MAVGKIIKKHKRRKLMNPLASGLMLLGILLLLFGIFTFLKHRQVIGTIFTLLGLAAIATPFIISYFLAP